MQRVQDKVNVFGYLLVWSVIRDAVIKQCKYCDTYCAVRDSDGLKCATDA